MVHSTESRIDRGAKRRPGGPALALRTQSMATSLVSVETRASGETRDVIHCRFCKLVQFRTVNSLCRKCHKPLDAEEVAQPGPVAVDAPAPDNTAEAGRQVAAQVREIRRSRHLSQRQLAGRMQVPRTYISKIENGKAIPTLGSLERLADALGVDVGQLVRDSRSRRQEQVCAILADPLLAEIAALLPQLDGLHRSLLAGAAREMAQGKRRTA